MDGLRQIFDKLLDADVRTRERILDDVHRDDPAAAKRLRAMIASAPDPVSTLGLWKKLPVDLPAVPTLCEGDRLDDFRVLAALGEGGLAAVYLAVDERLGRRVALKVSRSTGKEPRLLAKLQHPAIVQAYRAFRDAEHGVDVLVLQYVEGVTLEEATAQRCFAESDAGRKLDARLEARLGLRVSDGLDRDLATRTLRGLDRAALGLRIALELADALAFAHGRGVLHLDVKPSNVFLDRGGHAILGDFNVSVEDTDGRAIGGTPGYMAPEQAGTESLDARADVFALGRVVERMFADTPGDERPKGLDGWIAWMTRQTPDERPASMRDAAASLREIARWHELSQAAKATAPPFVRWTRERPLLATFVGALVPNAVMSALQILYNRTHIVDLATPAQQHIFQTIVGPWNLIAFSLGGWLLWKRFDPIRTLPAESALRRAVDNVAVGGAIASVGWLVGCTLFVASMGLGAPPLALGLEEHFAVSFVLAAALCAAYAGQAMGFVAAVAWFPCRFEPNRPTVVATAKREAARLGHAMRALTVACAALPLVGAAIIVWEGPGMQSGHGHAAYPFQALVVFALIFSCLGFAIASRLANWTRQALAAFQV